MLPGRVPIRIAFGDPIVVGSRVESPSKAQIEELKARYCRGLEALVKEFGNGQRVVFH